LLLKTNALEIELLPQVGGKIARVRDKVAGRELLVPPQRPYRTLSRESRWTSGDTSGMDDCFPNIAEGLYPREPWKGLPLPELGEWVYGAWDVVAASERSATLERAGDILPYRARKRIGFPAERAFELRYRVANSEDAPLQYMWAAHPLIVAGDDFELRLPEGEKRFIKFPHDAEVYCWPRFGGTDLSRQWVASGSTLKIFVTGLAEGWCELRLPTHAIRISFDPAAMPVLGLWFNNFGFSWGSDRPFRCIAAEPCTSPSDLLDALVPSAYPTIPPHSAAEWWVRFDLEPGLQS
jgi:hypothetical protein